MAGSFDPNRNWAAIPVNEQPARYTKRSVKRSKAKKQRSPMFAAIGGGLSAACVAVLFLRLYKNPIPEDPRPAANLAAVAPVSTPEGKVDVKPEPNAERTSGKVPGPPSKNISAKTMARPPSPPAPLPSSGEGSSGDERTLDLQATGRAQLIADETPPAAAQVQLAVADPAPETKSAEPKRLPVPEKSLQQAAEAKVRDIFQTDLAGAKTSDARTALAKKLLDLAESSKDDAAASYVLLRMAGEQAVFAGNVAQALDIVDKMQQRFQMAAGNIKPDVLTAILRQPTAEPAIIAAVFDAAMKLCEEAMAGDDFELSGRFAKAAAAAGRKTRDANQIRLVTARLKEIEQLKGRFAAVQKALDALETDASDRGANLVVGQWYCYSKGNWNQGLPMLAKGSRDDVAKLAKQDLVRPGDAKQQVALADAWWNLGEKEPLAVREAMLGRARHWYEQAVEKMTGLDKVRIQKRLEGDTAGAPGPTGREVSVDVTDLPFVGKTVVEGKPRDIIIDSLNLAPGAVLPKPSIPGAQVRHFIFLHATSEFQINVDPKSRGGQIPKRFKAYLYLAPIARARGSDGIVWTVEAGSKTRLKLLLTTSQGQDMNAVDVPLSPVTTRVIIRSLPGAANNENSDWGVMANPVVVFGR